MLVGCELNNSILEYNAIHDVGRSFIFVQIAKMCLTPLMVKFQLKHIIRLQTIPKLR